VTTDGRIVYGATCTWWDHIRAAAVNDHGLPCCPHCSGVLFEVDTPAQWWADVDRHAIDTRPGYRGYVEWLQGRCFPDHATAAAAYAADPAT
jgi:hypothetical protein